MHHKICAALFALARLIYYMWCHGACIISDMDSVKTPQGLLYPTGPALHSKYSSERVYYILQKLILHGGFIIPLTGAALCPVWNFALEHHECITNSTPRSVWAHMFVSQRSWYTRRCMRVPAGLHQSSSQEHHDGITNASGSFSNNNHVVHCILLDVFLSSHSAAHVHPIM